MVPQVEICNTLRLRSPLILRTSSERPNLHIACRLKPCEDAHVAANIIASLLLGRPCSLSPFVSNSTQAGGPTNAPGSVPPTVVYCVSKAVVTALVSVLSLVPEFVGKVRGSESV